MSPNPVTQVGVLGLGSIGLRHARLLRELAIDVMGHDPSAQASEALAELGGTSAPRGHVIANCDALVIATPTPQHLGDLNDALDAGKPALIEKPLGHNLAEARRLIGLAEARNVIVAAAHNLRFRSVVQQTREWLAEQVLGNPLTARFECGSYLPDWRPGQDYSQGYAADPATGGVIFDIIHEFDLALHLLGPAGVDAAAAAHSGQLDIASEDSAVIVLRHESGALSTLQLDYLRRPAKRALEIVGSAGVLSADLRLGAATITASDGTIVRQHEAAIERDAEYKLQLEDFLKAASGNGDPACSGQTALASLELVFDARERAGLPSPGPALRAVAAGDGR